MRSDLIRAAGVWVAALGAALAPGACDEILTTTEPRGTLVVTFDAPGATDADFGPDDSYSVEITGPDEQRFRDTEPARAPTTRVGFPEIETGVWTVEVLGVPEQCPLDPAEENPTTITVRESESTTEPVFTVNCP